jgi:hypothetical protein
MTNGASTVLSEQDWAKIQLDLGKTLSSNERLRDWHFTHWMTQYGNDFFNFFKKEQSENPGRLLAWWKEHQGSIAKKDDVQPDSMTAWEEIGNAWDEFPKKATMEAV